MAHLPPATPAAGLPPGKQVLAALALAGGFVWCACGLASGSWRGEQAPFPYAWRDVAVVQVLCAFPLAWALAVFLNRRLPAAASVGLAAFVLGVSVLPLAGAGRASLTAAIMSHPSWSVAVRAAPALGLALSAALASAALLGGRPAPRPPGGWGGAAAVGGLGVVVWLLLPATYVGARCRHDTARLGELLEQSRFGEARALAHALLVLDPQGKWNGHPLPQVAANLDRVVGDLESRVAAPLTFRAPARARLDRARQLAMLGRAEEALGVLRSVREPAAAADVDNLYATICETQGEWEAALGRYQSAQQAWEAWPPSPARTAGLLRATTGVAYCQRKSGRYAEAEATYQQVLALSPTADSHFLLAQFYEDAQQAEKARAHARRAMALAPDRYQQEGEKLIRKLAVFHFGCLGVFTAENDRPDASLAPSGGGNNP